jgi:hypothetical protein
MELACRVHPGGRGCTEIACRACLGLRGVGSCTEHGAHLQRAPGARLPHMHGALACRMRRGLQWSAPAANSCAIPRQVRPAPLKTHMSGDQRAVEV